MSYEPELHLSNKQKMRAESFRYLITQCWKFLLSFCPTDENYNERI